MIHAAIKTMTDFEIDLDRLDKEIAELTDTALAAPLDKEKATRYVCRCYQRASLTGNLEELETAGLSINEAIRLIGPEADLCFLKAGFDFKLHKLAEVKKDLEMSQILRDGLQGKILKADLDFQEGRYEPARLQYKNLISGEPTWDNLARLAYFEFKLGDPAKAEKLYIEAEDELTAKEMRSYSWLELQRGVLDLTRGRYDEAEEHYARAGKAYSGHWMVDEHLAELMGAQGRFDEAVSLYKKVIARTGRADFEQALGELYEIQDKPDQARECFKSALASYLESVDRGNVHYYHHLSDFYSDACANGSEAVNWASKDLELRRNFSTLAALAWALYRADRTTEAADAMNEALLSGVRDARIFYQAAMIYRRLSNDEESNRLERLATEINPNHQVFHVHR